MPLNQQAISIDMLNRDVLSFIRGNPKDEQTKSKFAWVKVSLWNKAEQKQRILERLARYAFEGNIEKVVGLLKIRPDLTQQVLFTLAGLGAQDEMEHILKKQPKLLLIYAPLRDISGASFTSITLFQHAIWAGDVRYMALMMLKCLPKNQLGEKIRFQLQQQLNELISKGVVYQLNSERHCEIQFSLKPLIEVLDTLVKKSDNWTVEELDSYLSIKVRHEQKRLPAHIRHHYCDPDESFIDTPSFTKEKLTRTLKLYHFKTNKCSIWSESFDDLGAVVSAARPRSSRLATLMPVDKLRVDLSALMVLDKLRKETDLTTLRTHLESPVQNPEEDMASRMSLLL